MSVSLGHMEREEESQYPFPVPECLCRLSKGHMKEKLQRQKLNQFEAVLEKSAKTKTSDKLDKPIVNVS